MVIPNKMYICTLRFVRDVESIHPINEVSFKTETT